jgi:hypothetical protein
MRKYGFFFLFCLVAVLVSGCAVENNHLTPDDFSDCLRRSGVKAEAAKPWPRPDMLKADSACSVRVGESDILVFKYDISSRAQRERIERIKQTRRVFVSGLPFYAYVQGSFVFLGLDKSKQKHEIIRAIKRFK